MKISVVDYDYKYKIHITKRFLYPKFLLVRKVKKIISNFPNYNYYWDNNVIVINLYFDDTGWEKDQEHTNTVCEISGNLITIKWVKD